MSQNTEQQRRHVLVMEEDESLRRVTGKILSQQGYKIGYAKDGDEAIALYQTALESGAPFDAVILDLSVSNGKGGVGAIQRLIEIDPGAKGIVCSGHLYHDAICNYQKYGFCGALTKPFDKDELISLVDELIESR